MLVGLADLFLAVVEVPRRSGVAELSNEYLPDAPTPAVKFEIVPVE
jgi:hypothetical protein